MMIDLCRSNFSANLSPHTPGVLLVVEARDDGRPLRPPLPLRLRPHRLVQPGDRGVPVVGASGRRTAGEN